MANNILSLKYIECGKVFYESKQNKDYVLKCNFCKSPFTEWNKFKIHIDNHRNLEEKNKKLDKTNIKSKGSNQREKVKSDDDIQKDKKEYEDTDERRKDREKNCKRKRNYNAEDLFLKKVRYHLNKYKYVKDKKQ